jgi:hypothetical protein
MKKFISAIVLFVAAILFPIHAYAHSGGTDSKGGHYNRSTGEYHYHHGYSAHQHKDMDGDGKLDCPYEFDDKDYYSEMPKATIDPNLLKEMEEWHEKIQEYTYPEDYSKTKESKDNEDQKSNDDNRKVTLKSAISNSSDSSKATNFDWYEIPIFVIGISVLFLLFSPFMDYLRPGLAEIVFDISLKVIVFSLPFVFLFDFLFMIFG